MFLGREGRLSSLSPQTLNIEEILDRNRFVDFSSFVVFYSIVTSAVVSRTNLTLLDVDQLISSWDPPWVPPVGTRRPARPPWEDRLQFLLQTQGGSVYLSQTRRCWVPRTESSLPPCRTHTPTHTHTHTTHRYSRLH